MGCFQSVQTSLLAVVVDNIFRPFCLSHCTYFPYPLTVTSLEKRENFLASALVQLLWPLLAFRVIPRGRLVSWRNNTELSRFDLCTSSWNIKAPKSFILLVHGTEVQVNGLGNKMSTSAFDARHRRSSRTRPSGLNSTPRTNREYSTRLLEECCHSFLSQSVVGGERHPIQTVNN